MTAVLAVRDLHTHFVGTDSYDRPRVAQVLNGVSFTVDRSRIVGVIGESGAGKSLTAMSVLGLLRPPARVVGGTAVFNGVNLLGLSPERLNRLRGNELSLVVQNPKTSLDPLCRIGDQLVRNHLAHRKSTPQAARKRAVELLASLGIPDSERRMAAWPHELSGGMAQRVLIGLALINEPQLLIADEPTTGLDVTVQAQILDLIRRSVRDRAIAAMIITHDLGVVAQYCDEVVVMYAGTVVESGPTRRVLVAPLHPYTASLIASTPEKLRQSNRARFMQAPPDLYCLRAGCAYRDRCELAQDICCTAPSPRTFEDGQVSACHRAAELVDGEVA